MKIIGNAVGAPMPRTDYNQEDPAKSDYLKGREAIAKKIEEAAQAAQTGLSKEGGVMEGALDMGGNALTGLPDPGSDGDAASWGAVRAAVETHAESRDNPHEVTAAQTGAVEMKLLWQNAAPFSAFAAQTISVDLSGYAYVQIDYSTNSAGPVKSQCCKVGEKCHLDGVTGSSEGGMAGAGVFTVIRQAEVSATAVAFTKCVRNKQNSTSVSFEEATTSGVPRRIFGIKGVK